MTILGTLACGCHVTDEGDGALHLWACCDAHATLLETVARDLVPDAEWVYE